MGNDKAEREKRSSPPPAKQSAGKRASTGYTPIVWAACPIPPAEKARLKAQELDADKAIDSLAYMVEAGHKLSINPRTSDGFIGVSIWGHTDECPNKGYGVSSEGGSLSAAIKALIWKLDVLDGDLTTPSLGDADDLR